MEEEKTCGGGRYVKEERRVEQVEASGGGGGEWRRWRRVRREDFELGREDGELSALGATRLSLDTDDVSTLSLVHLLTQGGEGVRR